jgi:DNA polymerase III alpha subunit
MDLEVYLVQKLRAEVAEFDFTDEEIEKRYYHLKMEYRIWKKINLVDMLRTLIYIVNTFEEHKIIWGTGRGSSCASYILYLVGLHQVDSVEYELDIGEFFR